MEDIVDAPHQQLLAEETEDFGDWRELVVRFDNIQAEASALPARRSTVTRKSADWNLGKALDNRFLYVISISRQFGFTIISYRLSIVWKM